MIKEDIESENLKIVKQYTKSRFNRGEIIESTRIHLESRLGKYAKFLDELHIFIRQPVEDNIIDFIECYGFSTKNVVLANLKLFYRWLYDLEKDDRLPDFIRKIKPRSKRMIRKEGNNLKMQSRLISPDEYQLLLDNAKNVKEKAIIEVLYLYGIRKGELRGLKSDCYREEVIEGNSNYIITVPESKTIPRDVPITEFPQYLHDWFNSYQPNKNKKNMPLFTAPVKHDRIMSMNTVNDIIDRSRIRAGIDRKIKVHDFRHTAISRDRLNNLSPSSIESRYGLVHGSAMISVYDNNGYNELLSEINREHKGEVETFEKVKREKKTLEEDHAKKIDDINKNLDFYICKSNGLENTLNELDKKYAIEYSKIHEKGGVIFEENIKSQSALFSFYLEIINEVLLKPLKDGKDLRKINLESAIDTIYNLHTNSNTPKIDEEYEKLKMEFSNKDR